ncbi:hypothetical protein [Maribacter sp. MAR_2009_72]|uniref:hypothetical protein n=1 Tax=Maribacter sp. MAR_2009_72 TaxID=1250050 RepID=UPI0011A9A0FD|nr:hypothetical protein [Maribacter sp. MAR_2009_72]
MRKLFIPMAAVLFWSCSTDAELFSENLLEESTNTSPILATQSLAVDEHSATGTSIGTIVATDADNDELSFKIEDGSLINIDEKTGEVTVGEGLVLDFETATSLSFTVSVFDGTDISQQTYDVTINDIDEYMLLEQEQKNTIDYFMYLTLWQSPTHTPLENSSRWQTPMNIYLDGSISTSAKADIENVLEEFNIIFEESSFSLSLVSTEESANAHLYLGETSELENLWADMYEIVHGKTYSGYAMTANNSSVLSNSRIWVSTTSSILLKHELGHALGFGHSDKCESENSFMCSNISQEHDFLELEKEILKLAYSNEMPEGLTEIEIKTYLANKMILGD